MRYKGIDTLRGLTILSMILYHQMWDLYYLYRVPFSFMGSKEMYYWQQSICCTFIFLAGFCWNFSKHPWKHGIQTLFWSGVVTGITCTFLPEERIVFGVLTFLGSAMLFVCVFHRILRKINPWLGCIINGILFILTKGVMHHQFGFLPWNWPVPEFWYRNLLTTYFGFPARDFYSTDYFGIVPWIFLFLIGYYTYFIFDCYLVKEHRVPKIISETELPIVTFMGRHSIFIYLIHQPILYSLYLIWEYFL